MLSVMETVIFKTDLLKQIVYFLFPGLQFLKILWLESQLCTVWLSMHVFNYLCSFLYA
jgi:hypothetical protein